MEHESTYERLLVHARIATPIFCSRALLLQGMAAVGAREMPPGIALDDGRGEPYESGEDEYSLSDDYYEESDDELDWDPDRERIIRHMRQQQQQQQRSSGQHPRARGDRSEKSLAERRNDWRASKGLSRQRSIAEMIAEKRAARGAAPRNALEAAAAHGAEATAPSSLPPATPTLEPPSYQPPPPIETPISERHERQATGGAASTTETDGSTETASSDRGKESINARKKNRWWRL